MAPAAPGLQATVNVKGPTSPLRTMTVKGLTRTLIPNLKADGFAFSWDARCWHKSGTDSELALLMARYEKIGKIKVAIQVEGIVSEGTNPGAFWGGNGGPDKPKGGKAKKAPKSSGKAAPVAATGVAQANPLAGLSNEQMASVVALVETLKRA